MGHLSVSPSMASTPNHIRQCQKLNAPGAPGTGIKVLGTLRPLHTNGTAPISSWLLDGGNPIQKASPASVGGFDYGYTLYESSQLPDEQHTLTVTAVSAPHDYPFGWDYLEYTPSPSAASGSSTTSNIAAPSVTSVVNNSSLTGAGAHNPSTAGGSTGSHPHPHFSVILVAVLVPVCAIICGLIAWILYRRRSKSESWLRRRGRGKYQVERYEKVVADTVEHRRTSIGAQRNILLVSSR